MSKSLKHNMPILSSLVYSSYPLLTILSTLHLAQKYQKKNLQKKGKSSPLNISNKSFSFATLPTNIGNYTVQAVKSLLPIAHTAVPPSIPQAWGATLGCFAMPSIRAKRERGVFQEGVGIVRGGNKVPGARGKVPKSPSEAEGYAKQKERTEHSRARFFSTNSYLITDFVEIQRQSFFRLLEKGLIEEFSKRNPITNKNLEIFFYPEYYQLTPPEYNPRRAILLSKSYSSKLYIPAQLTDKNQKGGDFSSLLGDKITKIPNKKKATQVLPLLGSQEGENKEKGEKTTISQLKWVLIGNLPLMTKRGHFVLNGAPRVIVNQILRSPGIYFQGSLKEIFSEKWSEKAETTYKRYYTDLICLRGTWLRIEIDKNKDIWAQMKKVPKIPLMWFLLAMGLTERIIFKSVINPTRLLSNFNLDIKRKRNYEYVTNPSDAWKEISHLLSPKANKGKQSTQPLSLSPSLAGQPTLASLSPSSFSIREESRSAPFPGGEVHTPVAWRAQKEIGGDREKIWGQDSQKGGKMKGSLAKKRKGLTKAGVKTHSIFRTLIAKRPLAKPPKKEKGVRGKAKKMPSFLLAKAKKVKAITNGSYINFMEHSQQGRNWIFKRFMNPRTYDLGQQGRLNFNRKLALAISSNQTTLTARDVLLATDYLLKVEKGLKNIDDIDHLKNRRVRTAGELLQIQIGIGLVRLEKNIREKFSKINAQTRAWDFKTNRPPLSKGLKGGKGKTTSEAPPKKWSASLGSKISKANSHIEEFKLNHIINTKAFNGALREFFGTSQLSQFMDQLNPLAEITHKRRLSSMGPGGVTRDSATLAIRGIHPTHYGRICPIETPEGKNTGLVNSLTTYARANAQGFLESPFYKVYKGQIQKNAGIFFLSAEQEENIKSAAADLASPFSPSPFSPPLLWPSTPSQLPLPSLFGAPHKLLTSKKQEMNKKIEQREIVSLLHYRTPLHLFSGDNQYEGKTVEGENKKSYEVLCPLGHSMPTQGGVGRIAFLPNSKIPAKVVYGDTISKISRNMVEYIGVSPIQMISIATSLIPFLEHDDANRALMGSNMQRQAVPLIRAERPLVGTGLEARAVSDSGHAVISKKSGYVAYASAKKIIIYTLPSNH